ncbi:hypothetical protein HMPREF1556_00983 [Porphyromonas sp. oral taxon 278 str. W7784]|nr:hypothetical protein HMPREF1556_00983 [Porphyromonas sp. oral taxon 278 str. W7784]
MSQSQIEENNSWGVELPTLLRYEYSKAPPEDIIGRLEEEL